MDPDVVSRNAKIIRMTPYGEQDANGVDVTLIRDNFRPAPIERARRGHEAAEGAMRMRKDVRAIQSST